MTATEGSSQRAALSVADVLEHVRQLTIFTSDVRTSLQARDIEMVLNTLVWDGRVERCYGAAAASGPGVLYKATPTEGSGVGIFSTSALVKVPCGACPLFDDCRAGAAGSVVAPETCVYVTEWLDLTPVTAT